MDELIEIMEFLQFGISFVAPGGYGALRLAPMPRKGEPTTWYWETCED